MHLVFIFGKGKYRLGGRYWQLPLTRDSFDLLQREGGGVTTVSLLSLLNKSHYPLPDRKSKKLSAFYAWLNMELNLQTLFGLCVYSCTHWLRPRNSPFPLAFRLIYEGAIGQPRIDDIPWFHASVLTTLGFFKMMTHLQASQSRSKNVSAGSRSLTVSWPLNSLGPKGSSIAYDAACIMSSVFTTKKGLVNITPVCAADCGGYFLLPYNE